MDDHGVGFIGRRLELVGAAAAIGFPVSGYASTCRDDTPWVAGVLDGAGERSAACLEKHGVIDRHGTPQFLVATKLWIGPDRSHCRARRSIDVGYAPIHAAAGSD